MSTLNKQQESAVTASLDPTVIVAGAGTGKTFVLINRIIHLIKELNIDNTKIYAITFSEKSMTEIKERIAKANIPNPPIIGTCHSLCLGLLKKYGEFKDSAVKILDVISAKELWKDASENAPINLTQIQDIYSLVQLKLNIKDKKNTFTSALCATAKPNVLPIKWDDFVVFSKNFESLKKKNQYYDFNDLLIECNKLLKQSEMCEVIRDKFSAILVDEFQDIDEIQFEILTQLTKHGAHIFCVGDPDQSIYGFRGAKPNIFDDFIKYFVNYKIIKLEQNYRSTPEILSISNQIISKNPTIFQKNLFTNNPSGKKVILSYAKNEYDSAEWIFSQIETILQEDKSANYDDIAILYRINFHSIEVEKQLNVQKVPYRIYGSWKLFDKPEIRHIKHYLTLVFYENSLSLESIINIPKRKLGRACVEKIHALAKQQNRSFYDVVMKSTEDISEDAVLTKQMKQNLDIFVSRINKLKSFKDSTITIIVKNIIEIMEYENFWPFTDRPKRMANIKSFVDLIDKHYWHFGKTITQALNEFDQISNSLKDKTPKVTLSTVHKAKGLEFKYVFIFKMNYGIMPYFRAIKNNQSEEERRIAYVALTRAKQELFLCACNNSSVDATTQDNISPYIKEIENSLIRVDVMQQLNPKKYSPEYVATI